MPPHYRAHGSEKARHGARDAALAKRAAAKKKKKKKERREGEKSPPLNAQHRARAIAALLRENWLTAVSRNARATYLPHDVTT